MAGPNAPIAPPAVVGINCDAPIPSKLLGKEVVNSISQVVSDVCFYGCFISILLGQSILKYSSLSTALIHLANSFLALGRYVLDKGLDLGGSAATLIQTLYNEIESIASGAISAVGSQVLNYDSFAEALWAFIKGEVLRYFQPLLLACIQRMVDTLKEELTNRATLLGIIENKLDTLQAKLNDLAGYDWWEDFVASVLVASRALRDADREVQNAHIDSVLGKWDDSRVEMAQNKMLLAWRVLSSNDAFNELMTELGEYLDDSLAGRPNRPFEWSFKKNIAEPFLQDLQEVAEVLTDLKKDYDCLVRITGRMGAWQTLIISATATLNRLREMSPANPALGLGIDNVIGTDILQQTHEALQRIHGEMRDVVENERRTVAPMYNMNWRNEIKGYIVLLGGLGMLPDPFGFDFVSQTTEASNQLNYIVYPHVPYDRKRSLSEYDFSMSQLGVLLETFILTVGHVEELLGAHMNWNRRFQDLRNAIRNTKRSDNRALDLLSLYEGYDDPKYDYVLELLENAGWDGAAKYLQTGQLESFMHLSVTELGLTTVAVQCISNAIASMFKDSSIAFRLTEILEDMRSEEIQSNRTAVWLPAFQFQAFQAIINRMGSIEARITDLLSMQSAVCG